MKCPHCNTLIDEHEASRCLDAWVDYVVFRERVWQKDDWPAYSTIIAVAWTILEETGGFWTVQGHLYEGRTKSYYAGRRGSLGSKADTAQLAICRAAIKASSNV